MPEARDSSLPIEEAPYWHLLPFGTFAVINVAIWWVWHRDLVRLQSILTPFNVALCGLAVYRIANIISNEQVTRVIRAPFIDQEEEAEGHIKETPRKRGWRHTIGSLLYCPSCVGVWAAALVVYLLIFSPSIGWVAVAIFALSACERIISSIVQAISPS